jgi:replicative DNA helicase
MWRAMQSLHARGEPIDYVMVADELRRLSYAQPEYARGPTQHTLAQWAIQEPTDPRRAIDTLVHASLFRRGLQAQEELRSTVVDHNLSAEQVVNAAERIVGELDQHARKVTGTSAPARHRSDITSRLSGGLGNLGHPVPPASTPPSTAVSRRAR